MFDLFYVGAQAPLRFKNLSCFKINSFSKILYKNITFVFIYKAY